MKKMKNLLMMMVTPRLNRLVDDFVIYANARRNLGIVIGRKMMK